MHFGALSTWACWLGLYPVVAVHITVRVLDMYSMWNETACGSECDGDITSPGQEVKLRRVKSHERGECETKLTRNRREETVKRVIKP
jgi:hypothetical protein